MLPEIINGVLTDLSTRELNVGLIEVNWLHFESVMRVGDQQINRSPADIPGIPGNPPRTTKNANNAMRPTTTTI